MVGNRHSEGNFNRSPAAPAGAGTRLVAVIPTLNESGNIGHLIDRLLAVFPEGATILVVDDQSADGTADIVRRHAAETGAVHLLDGPRRGLGAAYRHGFDHLFSHFSPSLVVMMDADFSHPPEQLPALIAALDDGADLVIGSRYLGGRRLPAGWSWRRRLLSWAGNRVARRWLGLSGIDDCTTAFRVWRASSLRSLAYGETGSQGYAFLVGLLLEARRAGLRVRECPVDFPERRAGASKLGPRQIFEFAAWAIRRKWAPPPVKAVPR